ncbi:hypothetical protein D3C72_2050470 [compost metagenome]
MALLLAAVCVAGVVGVVGDAGADVPVPGAVAAALAGVDSPPPPPPQPAAVMTRQASGKATSFKWMRFMDGPLSLAFEHIEFVSLGKRQR